MTRKGKLNLYLAPDLIARSKSKAEEGGSSVSVVVERLLENWLASGGAIPAQPKTAKKREST